MLRSKTYPDLSKVRLNYDEALRLSTASVKNSPGVEQTSLSYFYTLAGRVETVTQTLFGVSRTFSH